MNTFRNVKTRFILGLLGITIFAGAPAHGEAGSGGTTGGGDYRIGLEALLPDLLRVKIHGPTLERQQIGTRFCWGVDKCPIYAHEVESTLEFKKSEWMSDRKKGVTLTAIGTWKDVTEPVSPPVAGWFWTKAVAIGEDRSVRERCAEFRARFGQHRMDGPCRIERGNTNPLSAYQIEWDGTALTVGELVEKLTANWEVLKNQVDLMDFHTIRELLVYRELLEDPLQIKRRHRYVPAPELDFSSNQVLTDAFMAEAAEIEKFALDEVVDLGTSTCDKEAYEQLKTRWRRWQTGSRLWFARLKAHLGRDLLLGEPPRWLNGELVYVDLQKVFLGRRAEISLLISDSIVPLCEDPARSREPEESFAFELITDQSEEKTSE